MDDLVPVVLFITLAYTMVNVAEIAANWLTRRQLIRSGIAGDQAQALLTMRHREADRAGTLKWGLVAVAVGLALVLIQFLPYGPDEPIALGLVLIAAGVAFLLSVAATSQRAKLV